MIYNNLFHNNPGYLLIPGILPFMGVIRRKQGDCLRCFNEPLKQRKQSPCFSILLCDSDIDRLLYVDYLDFVMLAAVLSVQRPCDLLFG